MTALSNLFGGIRGASKEQQTQTFGQASLQLAQLALSSIPIFGTWLASALGKLGGTRRGPASSQGRGTAQDVAGFKQAIAYGDVKPFGTDVDLTKLKFVVGTNPFAAPAETSTPDLWNNRYIALR